LSLNYTTLSEVQLNRYKTQDFQKPFWDADDNKRAGVYYKLLPGAPKQNETLKAQKSNSASVRFMAREPMPVVSKRRSMQGKASKSKVNNR
jgi:hypothetical protein